VGSAAWATVHHPNQVGDPRDPRSHPPRRPVVDGSGAPARRADVAILGDRIAAVGEDLGEAKRVIDATGLLVTPGWVDIHTHYDST